MKQIEVDLLDIETAKASIAGRGHALAGRVLWIELRHDEHLIAAAGDRLADEPLRASVRIHLGCVDERHAELDPAAQRGNLVLAFARGLAHAPGALPEDGHGLSAWERRGTNTRHASEVEHERCRYDPRRARIIR